MMKEKISGQKLFLLLAAVLVCIAAASVISIVFLLSGQETGAIAEIYQNGELIRTVSLDGSEDGVFTVCGDDGSYNTIEIADGKIAVTDASCPDLLCVHMGWSNSSLLPIVCLPNGLVIEIKNSSDDDAPDAVSY